MWEQLQFLRCQPVIDGAVPEIVDIEIETSGDYHWASLPNGKVPRGTPMRLISALSELMLWDHLASHGQWPMLHGASIVVGGKRMLLLAEKGQGKSTLAVHMLAAGHAVEGDEHIAIGDDEVVARPRTLRVKPGTFKIIPGLPDRITQTPMLKTWDGVEVYAVSPELFGRPWHINQGPVHACLVLSPNRGGRSVVSRISGNAIFAEMMRHGYFGDKNVIVLAARLRRFAASVPAYSLRLGDLATAQWHLEQLAKY